MANMKALLFLFFFCCAAWVFSADITGEYWRYNSDSQDHDHLVIDENLNFLLEVTIHGKLEKFEGKLNIIGGVNYHTQIIYNGEIKNGYIYTTSSRSSGVGISITIYENQNDRLFYGSFKREKTTPTPTPTQQKKSSDFEFFPFYGSFGVNIEQSANKSENILSIDLYALYFRYLTAGLELEINPAKYFYNFYDNSQTMTFLNAGLSWSIMDMFKKDNPPDLSFGPVVSVNWLTLHDFNSLDINSVTFNAGFKLAYRYNSYSFLILESGYKNMAGEHRFYFSVRSGNQVPVLATTAFINWPFLFFDFD